MAGTGRNVNGMRHTRPITGIAPVARLTANGRLFALSVIIPMAAQTLTTISGDPGVMVGQMETAEHAPCVRRRRSSETMSI